MARLVDAVVYAGEPLAYTGSTDDLPPKIEETLRDYVDEGSSKAVYIMPLKEVHEDPEIEAKAYGALVVEQIEDNQPEPQLRETGRDYCAAQRNRTVQCPAISAGISAAALALDGNSSRETQRAWAGKISRSGNAPRGNCRRAHHGAG